MSEFFVEYGLYLLIALLAVIIVFLFLSGRQGATPPTTGQRPPKSQATKPTAVTPPAPSIEADPAPVAAAEPAASVPATPKAPAPKPALKKATAKPVARVEEPAPTVKKPAPAKVTASTAAKKAAAPATETPDDLLQLKGVGPKLNTLLIELGVTRFAQIAAWTDTDLSTIDAKLGTFKGRPVRDHWIDQAKYLAAGDIAGFEATYGKL
jgi:predicted flap endonuclease-1-like 5' DNA nuclease